jgi:protein-L-isoaspartate O-methyltransferase
VNLVSRLIRADETRKTRLHTGNGYLCLQPIQILRAFGSTIGRVCFRKYSRSPWLVYSSISYLAPLVAGKRVFEYGSGMSTVWFSERAQEVVAVENNSEWYNRVRQFTSNQKNIQVILAGSKYEYINAISQVGGMFDVILVDGMFRADCALLIRRFLRPDGLVIIDNTDVDAVLAEVVRRTFSDSRIMCFRGWVPGNLHPNETTIIDRIPVTGS